MLYATSTMTKMYFANPGLPNTRLLNIALAVKYERTHFYDRLLQSTIVRICGASMTWPVIWSLHPRPLKRLTKRTTWENEPS